MTRTVRIFIASSSENVDVAHATRSVLGRTKETTFNIDPAAWDQGTFKLSATYIESLEKEMDKADFSILILTPNDVARIRDQEVAIPRDNVLFELGLFIGRLHRDRCFILYERGNEPKLPTDLLGVAAATYPRSDRASLEDALSPVCGDLLRRVSEILEDDKLGSFVAHVEGAWWERIQAKTGFEISFFTIAPRDQYRSLYMSGDHFDAHGELIGSWKTVAVGITETERKLFYHWEGDHPSTSEGSASQVQGFGTLEFDPAIDRLEHGKGGFMDVDPHVIGTAQWKTVRIKRVTNKSHVQKMSKGSLADKKSLATQVLDDW